MSELASGNGLHPTMINPWKKALLDGAAAIFKRGGTKARQVDEDTVRALIAKFAELTDGCHVWPAP